MYSRVSKIPSIFFVFMFCLFAHSVLCIYTFSIRIAGSILHKQNMGSKKGISRGKYSTKTLQHGESVHCWECNNSYKRRSILAHHIRTKHMHFRASCPACGKQYVSVSVCNRHLKKVHNISNRSQFNINLELNSKSGAKKCSRRAAIFPSFGQLSFEADKAFPWMSNALSLQENIKFGKHVIAQRDIDVGQVIMATPGFASIECLSSIDGHCFQCGNVKKIGFIQCPHCINLWFCSKRCYSNKAHRSKCKKIFQASDCYIVRLVTEIITVAFEMTDVETMIDFCRGILFFGKKHKNLQPPYSSYGEVLRLKGLTEEMHFEIAKRIVKCILRLPKFKSSATEDFQRMILNIAYRHVVTIEVNVFSEESNVSRGVSTRFVIYDILCRFNHSCSPNIHHFNDENNITHCVAIRPIKKGDQVFISYLADMKFVDNQKRNEYIQQNWGFTCKCEKCSDSYINTDMEDDSSYEYISQNFTKLLFRDKNRMLQECVQFLRKRGYHWSKKVDFIMSCFISLINTS